MHWIDKYGRCHNVRDMSTTHLINAAAFLWRNAALRARGILAQGPAFKPAAAQQVIEAIFAEIKKRDAEQRRVPFDVTYDDMPLHFQDLP